MKERILQFLEAEKISPAEFADKIGVQRSSMSHILNGRNYPSATFIQKMLKVYPLVNSRWLLIGDGPMNLMSVDTPTVTVKAETIVAPSNHLDTEMSHEESEINREDSELFAQINEETDILNTDKKNESNNSQTEFSNSSQNEKVVQPDSKHRDDSGARPRPEQSSARIDTQPGEKEIEQILFFYTDKTFRIYRPS